MAAMIKDLVKHTVELRQHKEKDPKMTWKQLWEDLNGYLSFCTVQEAISEFEGWVEARRQVRLE